MSVYFLLQGRSTTTGPAGNSLVQPPLVAMPPPPSPGTGTPISNTGFQVTVQAPGGINVGAVVTVVASNDQVNWATLTTITVASAASPQTTITNLVSPYNSYGAFLPTITGSGATVTCTMSA